MLKMRWLEICLLVVLTDFGNTQKEDSDVSKFWTDDFKVFEQVYGRTSDRDLYGATLPSSLRHDGNNTKKNDAVEKKDKSSVKNHNIDAYGAESHVNSDGVSQQHYKVLKKTLKNHKTYAQTPQTQYPLTQAKSSVNFVTYSDFKPITQISDPQTYNYLRHGTGGFKGYKSYTGSSPEGYDSYRSIQDILRAHDANKGALNKNIGHNEAPQYINRDAFKNGKKMYKSKHHSHHHHHHSHDSKKEKCLGKCRKRGGKPTKLRKMPVVRKMKHYNN